MTQTRTEEFPVIWLQAATCTGCSVSALNSVSPGIKNVLIDPVLPGKHINLRYHATIMAGAGERAIHALEDSRERLRGRYVLILEGAIPTRGNGRYGSLGEKKDGLFALSERVVQMAEAALGAIALGTCAAYGGIAAAAPNPSGSVGLCDLLRLSGIATPVVNVPGCAPHPAWLIGTIATVLLSGLPKPGDLDEFGRPKAFYGRLIHENCQRRAWYDEQKFAKKIGDEGCLFELGCKGPVTHADCPVRLWNGGANWCVGSGGMCLGCTSPGFPDLVSPLYEKTPDVSLPNIGAKA